MLLCYNGKQNEVDGEEANEPEEPTYNELDLGLEELIAQTFSTIV